MEKLITGHTAALLSTALDAQADWRPVFDWNSVINLCGIVYAGLDALSDHEAAALDNSLFADLTSVRGSFYKFDRGRRLPGEMTPRRIAIPADEFIPLLRKAGGRGFQGTAYTRTWSEVEAPHRLTGQGRPDCRELAIMKQIFT